MSDFLNNVIAKNSNLAPVIQPRLPSLFEPPVAAGKLSAGQATGSNELETAPTYGENAPDFPEPAITMTRIGIASQRPAAQTLPIAHEELPPMPETAKVTMMPDMRQSPGQLLPALRPIFSPEVGTEVEPRPLRKVMDAESNTTPRPSFSNVQPVVSDSLAFTRATPIIHAKEAPVVPPKQDENDTPPLRNATEQPQQRAPESPVVERTVIERVVAPRESSEAVVAPKTPNVIASPKIKPYVPPVLPAPAKTAEKTEPMPTIQVTIGRIEVKATPPPAPSRKQTSAPAIMSLEDYLRQRAGGGA